MDAAGLNILLAELMADCEVAHGAAQKAAERIKLESPGHLEACAYELARCHNVLEKMFERICGGFENNFEKRGDYHEKLIQRLVLKLKGIRAAFIAKDSAADIRELKGFRHIMRHAYELTLRADRLADLVGIAGPVTAELPACCRSFADRVRAEQGWK